MFKPPLAAVLALAVVLSGCLGGASDPRVALRESATAADADPGGRDASRPGPTPGGEPGGSGLVTLPIDAEGAVAGQQASCLMSGRALVARILVHPSAFAGAPTEAWSDDTGELRTDKDDKRQAGQAHLASGHAEGDAVMARITTEKEGCRSRASASAASLGTGSDWPAEAALTIQGARVWNDSDCETRSTGTRIESLLLAGRSLTGRLPRDIEPNTRIQHAGITLILNEQVETPQGLRVTGVRLLYGAHDAHFLVTRSLSTDCGTEGQPAKGCEMTGRAAVLATTVDSGLPPSMRPEMADEPVGVWMQDTGNVRTRVAEVRDAAVGALDNPMFAGSTLASHVETRPKACSSLAWAHAERLEYKPGPGDRLPAVRLIGAASWSSTACDGLHGGTRVAYLEVAGHVLRIKDAGVPELVLPTLEGGVAGTDQDTAWANVTVAGSKVGAEVRIDPDDPFSHTWVRESSVWANESFLRGDVALPPNTELKVPGFRITLNDQQVSVDADTGEAVTAITLLRIRAAEADPTVRAGPVAQGPPVDVQPPVPQTGPPLDVRFLTARSDIHGCEWRIGVGIPPLPGVPVPPVPIPGIPPVGIPVPCVPTTNPAPGALPDWLFCPVPSDPNPPAPPPPSPPPSPPPAPPPPPPPPPPPGPLPCLPFPNPLPGILSDRLFCPGTVPPLPPAPPVPPTPPVPCQDMRNPAPHVLPEEWFCPGDDEPPAPWPLPPGPPYP